LSSLPAGKLEREGMEEKDRKGTWNSDVGKPTLIFRTWERTEAELIKGILEGHGITCMLSSDIAHTIYPFSMDGLGEIRIYVPEEKAEEAEELIKAFSEQKEGSEAGEDEQQ